MAARVLTHIHSSRGFYSHLLLEWKVPGVCLTSSPGSSRFPIWLQREDPRDKVGVCFYDLCKQSRASSPVSCPGPTNSNLMGSRCHLSSAWYHWLTKDCILWIRFKMPKLLFSRISVPDYSLWGRGVIYECYELSKKARFLNRALSHVSQIPSSALLGLLPYLPRNTRHDYRPEFWSVHGTFIHFPSHFLTSSYLPWTPDNSNTFFDFSRRFELSRVESTVVYLWVSLQNVHWRISHLYKRYNNTHLPKFFFKFFSPENSFKYNSTACVNF